MIAEALTVNQQIAHWLKEIADGVQMLVLLFGLYLLIRSLGR